MGGASGDKRSWRSAAPSGVAPGSWVRRAPSAVARARAWVVLPEPSFPSSASRRPDTGTSERFERDGPLGGRLLGRRRLLGARGLLGRLLGCAGRLLGPGRLLGHLLGRAGRLLGAGLLRP